MKQNNFLVKGIALSALTAALALSASLVLSGCGSKSPEKIAAEIEKLQAELEKTQSAGDAEIAETNSGTASGGIKGFIKLYPVVAGIITGLAAAFFCKIIMMFFTSNSYDEGTLNAMFCGCMDGFCGLTISVAFEIAGIIAIIVAGF
ncbi:MAG: hypothetical protein LBC77_07755, partial [Spirochaetaceae bacterium]|nr:hypothetical protein [Spirochaetaceae bacterium]